jgi:hypothetical protein
LAANDILRVLYAPQRAFKEIVTNPRYLGPFIVLIIFAVAQVGSSYVVASRSYIEQTMPAGNQGDVWTGNATLWAASPGVTITNNYADFINGSYYGSSSIEFAVSNSTDIQMALKDLGGSVNCGADGFKNISLRVKLVAPDVKPENVTMYLYSLSDLNFFNYDLSSQFSNTTVNVWNNLTIPVGPSSGDWRRSDNAASWENITSLKMDFAWSSNSNIEMRIDGLFFRGIFKDPLEIYGVSYFATSALNAVTPFIFQWLLLTGLMYVIIKGLKGTVTWKPLMVAVGFALVTMVIQALISIATYATLPKIYYPLEVLAGVPGEFDLAYKVILDEVAQVSLIGGIVQVAIYVWIIALGAFITRYITIQSVEGSPGVQQFGWMKSFLVSGASFLLTLLILGFVLGV